MVGETRNSLEQAQPLLDPVLKQQFETELHAGYAFNAKTAKWFRPFVWAPALLTICGALATLGTIVAVPVVFSIEGAEGPWGVPLLATVPLAILTAFFRLIWRGMSKAQRTRENMADHYNAAMMTRSAAE